MEFTRYSCGGSCFAPRRHAAKDPVLLDEVVPERRQPMQSRQAEEAVGKHFVNFLGGLIDRLGRGHAEVQLEQAEIEDPGMPDEGDDPHHWQNNHQGVKRPMDRMG